MTLFMQGHFSKQVRCKKRERGDLEETDLDSEGQRQMQYAKGHSATNSGV